MGELEKLNDSTQGVQGFLLCAASKVAAHIWSTHDVVCIYSTAEEGLLKLQMIRYHAIDSRDFCIQRNRQAYDPSIVCQSS